MTDDTPLTSHHVLLFGATGTAGFGAFQALVAAGHKVTVFVRHDTSPDRFHNARVVFGDITDPTPAFDTGPFDTVVSCLASRTGTPLDAWNIDHDAHQTILACAQRADVPHFVLLSAICVQKPMLAFQQAKLAFEASLMSSGLTYTIVRPTAFFKSLSGQIDRLRAGKPFLLFGNGALTACKPISDGDLGRYLALCVTDPALRNRILPIGGPGPAITPLDQGAMLFDLLGKTPRYKHVPVAIMDGVHAILRTLGHVSKRVADKAELVRIGRYYATESMLVFDHEAGAYDAEATPSFGTENLRDHYARLIATNRSDARKDHAVF